MEQVYSIKEDCCGCGSCAAVCEQSAIIMQMDECGFAYPFIDEQKCLGCGRCRSICAFSKDKKDGKQPVVTYAAINKNMDVLNRSASGGVFGVLAEYVLDRNGVVFGCAFDEKIQAIHIGVEKYGDIKKIQGSKYVQSYIGDCYKQIKKYLQDNRLVLFTGTPCQVGALNSFLGKEYGNLITADLSCHGVPSPEFFRNYVNFLNKKYHIEIKNFCFRGKYDGWGKTVRIEYEKCGEEFDKLIQEYDSYYCTYFLNRSIMRDSCYNCKYMCVERPGDFTMCDYWGVEETHPDVNRTNGVSALLVNSLMGQKIINLVRDKIELFPTNLEKILVKNGSLRDVSPIPEERERILTLWKTVGADGLDKDYQRKYKKYIIKRRIIKCIPDGLKRKIKGYLLG
ncbi:MAG: hypothetical protein VR69_02755 [Peptococcaceae bacterium BRH_c4b]|nr:MAG: hypothetical protein VR69_02755 [Peptococcaceae bacterium BRH_c4b]